MISFSQDRINSSFFAFGYLKEPAAPELENKIEKLGESVTRYSLDGFGYFFFTTPFYIDVSENADMVWIKLDHAHDGERLLTTDDMLSKGWIGPNGVDFDNFQGSVTLIGFNKHRPECLICSNILSTSIINYFNSEEVFFVADNLRLMANLLPKSSLNNDILPQHFMFRAVYGKSTYLKDVYKLISGEKLTWNSGNLSVKLGRDIRAVQGNSAMMPVSVESVNLFFDQLRTIVGLHLRNASGNSATMLSGGVDSTLIQAAINQELSPKSEFPTISYYLETKAFEDEIEYAKRAAHALKTKHSFVKIAPEVYQDFLIRSIEVLGQPVPDDVRPCFLMLTNNLPDEAEGIDHFFHGIDAEVFGVQESIAVIQGDKYRNWPVPLLKFLAGILKPISKSKSYGARTAAKIINIDRFPDSPDHFLNSEGMYTDMGMVSRCFTKGDISRAFMINQALESDYHGSNLMVEKINTLDLLTDGVNTTGIMNQLGHFSNINYIFPYADEMILKSAYSYDPLVRYTQGNRVKPILKSALEMQVPELDVNQPKGWSGMGQESLFDWMREGELREMVHAIERPGFLNQGDFKQKVENPDWFTWSLLTMDLFKKQVLRKS